MWLLPLLVCFLFPSVFLLSCIAAKKDKPVPKKRRKMYSSSVSKASSSPLTTTTTTTTTKSNEKAETTKYSRMMDPPTKTLRVMETESVLLCETPTTELYNSMGMTEEQVNRLHRMPPERREQFSAFVKLNLFDEILELDRKYVDHSKSHDFTKACHGCASYREGLKSLATNYHDFCGIKPDANAETEALHEMDERLLLLGLRYCTELKRYIETGGEGKQMNLRWQMKKYRLETMEQYKNREKEIKARNRKDREREQRRHERKMAKKVKELREKERQLKKKEQELVKRQKQLDRKEKVEKEKELKGKKKKDGKKKTSQMGSVFEPVEEAKKPVLPKKKAKNITSQMGSVVEPMEEAKRQQPKKKKEQTKQTADGGGEGHYESLFDLEGASNFAGKGKVDEKKKEKETGKKKKQEAHYESLFNEDIEMTAETQESIEDNFNP